ncbi:MAG TPA: CRISPR-associated RAMP protein [Clostridia bacterium]|nr:CRISPR-associated RAMP protein [Clostridia bacterium]
MADDVGLFYNVVRSRRRLTGRLVVLTPLHIGAGDHPADPLATDNPVIRDVWGRPFIPGSSFKGVWRAFAEQVLGVWGSRDAEQACRRPCDVVDHPCLSKDEAETLKQKHKDDSFALAEAVYARLCPACRLFGSPHFAGRVRVRDLLLESQNSWPGFFEVRPGVAIDRDSRTAFEGRKFEVETVPTQSVFSFEAIVENASDEEWRSVVLTLLPFTRGEMTLGGGTGRGLGRVILQDLDVRVVDRDNIREFLIKGWDALPALSFPEACRQAGLTSGGADNV